MSHASDLFSRWGASYWDRDEEARRRRLALRHRRNVVLLAREVIGAFRRTPRSRVLVIVGDEPIHWRWQRIAAHQTDDLRAELGAQGATFEIEKVEIDAARCAIFLTLGER